MHTHTSTHTQVLVYMLRLFLLKRSRNNSHWVSLLLKRSIVKAVGIYGGPWTWTRRCRVYLLCSWLWSPKRCWKQVFLPLRCVVGFWCHNDGQYYEPLCILGGLAQIPCLGRVASACQGRPTDLSSVSVHLCSDVELNAERIFWWWCCSPWGSFLVALQSASCRVLPHTPIVTVPVFSPPFSLHSSTLTCQKG